MLRKEEYTRDNNIIFPDDVQGLPTVDSCSVALVYSYVGDIVDIIVVDAVNELKYVRIERQRCHIGYDKSTFCAFTPHIYSPDKSHTIFLFSITCASCMHSAYYLSSIRTCEGFKKLKIVPTEWTSSAFFIFHWRWWFCVQGNTCKSNRVSCCELFNIQFTDVPHPFRPHSQPHHFNDCLSISCHISPSGLGMMIV